MRHIRTVARSTYGKGLESKGCGECRSSCQSACKTSCTVGNQRCEGAGAPEAEAAERAAAGRA